MRQYEFSFGSVNTEHCAKLVTVLVIEPDTVNSDTGVMLFSHGWAGNRFQHADKMQYAVNTLNLAAIAVEYRQSGYDCNLVTGRGVCLPYDFSFYQVFDVLNGLRSFLDMRPGYNRHRLFHYGGSQGGHIALLTSIFAPSTFAGIYASVPLTNLDARHRSRAGRIFAPDELSIRNVLEHAELIRAPVFIEYGDADETVNCQLHAMALQTLFSKYHKQAVFKPYPGGGHNLMPTTSRLDAFKAAVPDLIQAHTLNGQDDFVNNSIVSIPCATQTLRIDWGLAPDNVNLFQWQPGTDLTAEQ